MTRPKNQVCDTEQFIASDSTSARGVWKQVVSDAQADLEREPALGALYHTRISQRSDLFDACSYTLAPIISDRYLTEDHLINQMSAALRQDESIARGLLFDLHAVLERDPATTRYIDAMLFLKGFQALSIHRFNHFFWKKGQLSLAKQIQYLMSRRLQTDIHPAATLGTGVMLDHATGFVCGETAAIGNDVSILHGVTLGGSGHARCDRHPKIGNGVLIGANATILGNITLGDGAKIGAGSVVLKDVPAGATAIGVPARIIES